MAKKVKGPSFNGISATIPNKFYLVAGDADADHPLNAFDGALISAGVGNTNLMKMSSILPPNCTRIKPIKLPLGALIPIAYGSKVSSVADEVVAAGVAVAIPKNKNQNGLIMEYSARGHKEEVEKIVRGMAEEGMRRRKYAVKEILSIAIEHKVKKHGAAFAAVVLWW